MCLTTSVRLALDTCAVRAHIHQDLERPDLKLIGENRDLVLVSISEVAVAELLIALLENRITWGDWTQRIHELNSVLDPEMPILPGGPMLAAMAGLFTESEFNIDDGKSHGQAMWRLLVSATSPDDLKRGIKYQDSQGTHLIKADLALAKNVVSEERDRWIKFIDKMKCLAKDAGWSPEKVKAIVLVELQPKSGEAPDFAVKLDLLGHFLADRISHAAQSDSSYDPTSKKRKNDGIDISLLYLFALPAIICTVDKWFIGRVQEAESPQSSQIITITELNAHLRNGTLNQCIKPCSCDSAEATGH